MVVVAWWRQVVMEQPWTRGKTFCRWCSVEKPPRRQRLHRHRLRRSSCLAWRRRLEPRSPRLSHTYADVRQLAYAIATSFFRLEVSRHTIDAAMKYYDKTQFGRDRTPGDPQRFYNVNSLVWRCGAAGVRALPVLTAHDILLPEQ